MRVDGSEDEERIRLEEVSSTRTIEEMNKRRKTRKRPAGETIRKRGTCQSSARERINCTRGPRESETEDVERRSTKER